MEQGRQSIRERSLLRCGGNEQWALPAPIRISCSPRDQLGSPFIVCCCVPSLSLLPLPSFFTISPQSAKITTAISRRVREAGGNGERERNYFSPHSLFSSSILAISTASYGGGAVERGKRRQP